MSRKINSITVSLVLAVVVLGVVVSGCARDPNVRKRKYMESAQGYFENGQNREAMIQYMNALQVDPKYAEAHYGLAQVNLKMGAWNSAFVELSRTVELQPDNLKAQLDLGNLELAGGDSSSAMKRAELILAKDAGNVGAYVLKASVHGALGEQQPALEALQKAILLAPERSELYVNLGTLQVNAGRPAEAEASFSKAVELSSGSSAPLLALASFYQQNGRLAEAEQQFQRAVQAEPKQLAPRFALTRFYMQQNRREQAEQLTRETAALEGVPEAKTVLVDFYAALGETDKALATAAALYRTDQKNVFVREAYVRMLLASRQFDEATRVNQETLKSDPNNVNALIAKGQIYNNTGKPAEAIQIVENALTRDSDNAVGHYVLGVSANMTDDAARAEKEWREAVRLRPSMVEAQQALAAVALRKGDLDLLARSSEELVKAQPTSPDGYVLRALAAANRKQPAKVEDDLQRAIAVAPRNALGYTKLGVWRLDQKKYAAAEKLFEQALALDANAGEALQGLIKIYVDEQKNLPKAFARMKAQIERAPSNSMYYMGLAVLQNRAKDAASAEQSLEKAIQLDGRNVEALMLLAELQSASGRQAQAVATYERLIRDNPKELRALLLLAVLEQSRSNWQRAQSLYEKVLQLSPQNSSAANNLAYLLLEHGGNLDQALSLAQTARRSMPDSTTTVDTLAWAYFQKGIYPAAVSLLEECVRKAPQNPNYHFHLGLALQKQNERVKARKHLEQVLKLDPKYPNAQRVRQALSELGV